MSTSGRGWESCLPFSKNEKQAGNSSRRTNKSSNSSAECSNNRIVQQGVMGNESDGTAEGNQEGETGKERGGGGVLVFRLQSSFDEEYLYPL